MSEPFPVWQKREGSGAKGVEVTVATHPENCGSPAAARRADVRREGAAFSGFARVHTMIGEEKASAI